MVASLWIRQAQLYGSVKWKLEEGAIALLSCQDYNLITSTCTVGGCTTEV